MTVDKYARDTLLHGRLVATVWCRACGDKGKRLANVNRDDDDGRLRFSTRTTTMQRMSAETIGALKQTAKRRIPLERSGPLDGSIVEATSVHRLRCPAHGEAHVEGAVILAALRTQRLSTKPAVVAVDFA